jgi:hypothetical protein
MCPNNTETEFREALKELAYENRWIIQNRWMSEEHQESAKRVADKLVALASGESVEPVLPEEGEAPLESAGFVPPAGYEAPEWLVTGSDFPIVGRRFQPAEFIAYVKWVKQNETYTWNPSGITMHHTGYPDLALRPNGFNEQHMRNLRSYYRNDKGWRHGPHIFTDDHGIWVLNPLSIRGVHASSYNSTRYGIEMLGNFDNIDEFNSERGIASRYHGKVAAAVLMKHAGISTSKLNFHRHDRLTSKKCPGRHVDFSAFEEDVLKLVDAV